MSRSNEASSNINPALTSIGREVQRWITRENGPAPSGGFY